MIPHAIEVFVRGFAYTRSFTYPFKVDRIDRVWVMRDAPRTRGTYRLEEWVCYGVSPDEVDRIAREHTRGRYAICAIRSVDEPAEPLHLAYKSLGYRHSRTEPLMVHDLRSIPTRASPIPIERVQTQELADKVKKAARSRQVLGEHLTDDSKLRAYVALDNEQPVGWVRSITVGEATWCSNMFVHSEYRRRGIASAMLARMLRDDRAAGAKRSVLLASHIGAKLYQAAGYEHIGTLSLFRPPKQ